MVDLKATQYLNMKTPCLIPLLLVLSSAAQAENINYYCEGETTSTIGNGPHVEEVDTKTYAMAGNEIELYSEKVKCDVNQKAIHCHSKKFNRTLDINKATGYTTDTYEILKNGKPHAKIEFIGMCETY
jgi:hypothetical protein